MYVEFAVVNVRFSYESTMSTIVASAVLGKLYELLSPGGEMAIGNFHVSNPSRTYMDYWLDWVLYYRTEEDFKNLFQAASPADVKVFTDDTEIQMFLCITKPN